MKIAILIDRLNVGGVEKIAIEQVKALRLLGEDAYLVVLSRKAIVEGAFKDLLVGIPIIYLDDRLPNILRVSFKFPFFYFFSFFHISYPFFIPLIIKNNEFDYIISHGTYTSFTAIAIRKIKDIPFSPFIWDPIGYILNKVYRDKFSSNILHILLYTANFFDKLIISNSDVILVGGDVHNKYFRNLCSDKKIITIIPSVHPEKTILHQKEDYCLLITAWKKGKNPEYIIDLAKLIPSLKIKMAGKWIDREYEVEFINLLKKENLKSRIEILGEVTEKQLSMLYKKALFLLQINDDRGFGMPALEAAGHGTTFIIPKGQGVCKLFENRIDGFYTKEKYTKEIHKYVVLLLENKDVTAKMGKNAWEKVKERYSWETHAKMLREVYIQYAH